MVVGVALVALAGCGGEEEPAGGTDTGVVEEESPLTDDDESLEPTEEPSEDVDPGEDAEGAVDGADDSRDAVTLDVAETSLGEVITDGEGMTLYMFDPDEQGPSTCYDDCATAWPPLLVDEPNVGENLDDAMLGTVERDDGAMQVTYNDWPLYRWQGDAAAGDATGQGVNDVWWVVGPDGEPMRMAADS